MDPTLIETLCREEHEFQVMLWPEGTGWRGAWREMNGRHWHGVHTRHASADAAREAACTVALRSRQRRGPPAGAPVRPQAEAVPPQALRDRWTEVYAAWRVAQDRLDHAPPADLGEFMQLRTEADRLQRQLDRFTTLALRRTTRGRRGAYSAPVNDESPLAPRARA